MPLPSGAYRQFRIVVIREENAQNPAYRVIVPRESGQFSPKHLACAVTGLNGPYGRPHHVQGCRSNRWHTLTGGFGAGKGLQLGKNFGSKNQRSAAVTISAKPFGHI